MIPSMNPVHGETDDGTSEMLCGDAAASGAMGTISRLSLLVGVVVLDESASDGMAAENTYDEMPAEAYEMPVAYAGTAEA